MEDKIINNKSVLVWRNARAKKGTTSVLDVRSRHSFEGPPGWQRIKWKDVNQGDILKILEDETFPCDMVFISSSEPEFVCYNETSNLDGETNLKMKQANPTLQKRFSRHGLDCLDMIDDETMDTEFTVEKSNNRLYDFNGNVTIPKPSGEAGIGNNLVLGTSENLKEVIPLSINDLLLRGTVLKNTASVIGFATYVGHESKIYMNSTRPPIKLSNVTRRLNTQICLLFGLVVLVSVLCTIGTVINADALDSHWYLGGKSVTFNFSAAFYQVLTFMVLYSTMIPISLLVSLDFNRLWLAWFVNNDLEMYDAERDIWSVCKTSNLMEELGQVKYIFTDKTGTLTRNIMEFKLACIDGKKFDVEQDKIVTDEQKDYFRAVGLCHTVIAVEENGSYKYKAASPDEEALVAGAASVGFKFTHKSPTEMTIFDKFQDKSFTYDILATLEFSSARQCMSIILKERFDENKIFIYSKGSDAVLMDKIVDRTQVEEVEKMLSAFASEGLRTLCFGVRELNQTEFDNWHKNFKKAQALLFNREKEVEKWSRVIEGGLNLLGASAIEDRLQDKVPETIFNLRKSGIHIWMLTGDKVETAINIAYSASLLQKNSGLIVIDDELEEVTRLEKEKAKSEGKKDFGSSKSQNFEQVLLNVKDKIKNMSGELLPSIVASGSALEVLLTKRHINQFLKLALKCNTVVCARVTPSQKALVTKRVKIYVGPNCVTLAIGDGANDVPMIQSASLGIGISGQEGLQAANNSDYAIPQFRYLEKLLLVHGSWNYHRISKCILYFFYKNSSLHLQQLWFAPFNLYSGTNMFENWHLAFYNAAFLLYPPMAIAIFERPYPKKYLLNVPKVYQLGQEGEKYNAKLFIFYIINSIYHSLFLFFLVSTTLLTEQFLGGKIMGLEFVGHIVYTCTMILCTYKCQTEVTGLTIMHWVLIYQGVFLWIIYHLVYSKFTAWGIYSPSESISMTEMGANLFSSGLFWVCVIVFPVTVAIPDFLWRTWQNAIFNSEKLSENSHIQINKRSNMSLKKVGKDSDEKVKVA